MNRDFSKIAYVLILMSVGFFSTDIYLPSLPSITEYFQTTDSLVQLTLFFYMLSFSMAPIIFAPFSDHYGRKVFVVIGVLICALSVIGCTFSSSINMLITFRFFQGIGAGIVVTIARSIFSDYYSGKELARKAPVLSMSVPVFLALAPAIGGYLQEFIGWQSVFVFSFFYFFAVLCITYPFKESLQKEKDIQFSIRAPYRALLKTPCFLLYTLGYAIPCFGMFGYFVTSPFLFQNLLGISPSGYGLIGIYTSGVIFLTSYVVIHLLKYFHINTVILFGCFMSFISGVTICVLYLFDLFSFWGLLAPVLMYFSVIALCVPTFYAKAVHQISRNFGAANAIISSIQILLGSLATLIFSFIKIQSYITLGLCYIAISLLCLLILVLGGKWEKQNSSQS